MQMNSYYVQHESQIPGAQTMIPTRGVCTPGGMSAVG